MSYNLFEDPDIMRAADQLDEATKARYKRLGASLYEDIDFETCADTGAPAFFSDTVARVETLINSGMHISALEEGEKEIMVEMRGEDWYTRYGFVEGDLNSIVTVDWNRAE